MNCRMCNTPYEPTPSLYQQESRNRLFCFEDVPALKCPECEHLFLPEATVKIILEQISTLSQGSPIPYIKYKWNKKTNIQTPDELADELLKKGGTSSSDEFDEDAGMEPAPPMEQSETAQPAAPQKQTAEPAPRPRIETTVTRTSAPAATSASDDPAPTTISATRTKGVVVRKRSRARTGNAA